MKQQEAILARDIISMIREYKDDVNVLEYLESFASSIAQLLNNKEVVNWEDIAGICDQRYFSLKNSNPIDLNTELLDLWERNISKFLPENNGS